MKKLVILTALATMSFSGSAMAIRTIQVTPPEPPRAITIEGLSAGTGRFVFLFSGGPIPNSVAAPNGTCGYNLLWRNNPLFGDGVCNVLEATTATNPSCIQNMMTDINSTAYAGDGFTPTCMGFTQMGMPFGPPFSPSAIMILGEIANTVALTPSLVGIIQIPVFPFLGAQGITFA
ncbi:hypothetical protein WME79_29905 [Sorangium sp. So ce726]|uniref:hypothetical protein n=1 Tax=Sorangium sp. So ce726 TaxID=3133319 RepID=UPI003F6354A3